MSKTEREREEGRDGGSQNRGTRRSGLQWAHNCVLLTPLVPSTKQTYRLLLVWEDNVPMESLNHEQCLAQRSRPFPQDLIRLHGDDGTQGKDERVDILHVEVVGCHSVRHRIVGEALKKREMKMALKKLCF